MFPPTRKYPKEITVNGNTWSVRFIRKPPDHPQNVGLSDPETRTNYIKLGQGRKETFKTFIHELIHAYEIELDAPRLPHGAKTSVFPFLEDMVAMFWEENSELIFQMLLDTFGEG
jgi:hypothetical protein